jgi:predicted nucleotidyltransferase
LLHLHSLKQAMHQRSEARAARLRELLPEARRFLIEDCGAREVRLFGSLASDTATDGSDVDLATTGLPECCYFRALAALMKLVGGPVDLVRLEEADESLRDRIAREGLVL